MDVEKIRKTEAILKSIGIPTQSKILVELNAEINKVNVSIQNIANLVSKDVALSAQILKVANSPFFAVRKCDSIVGAINVLGLNNFKSIVLVSAMKNAIKIDNPVLEKFWNHSMLVARVASLIAKKLRDVPDNHAFMAGLFHDCATPYLLRKFPAYAKDIDMALGNDTDIVEIEDREFNTSHAVGGYIIAKSMGLTDDICNIIMHHHNPDISIHGNPIDRRLAACLFIADCISFCQGLAGSDSSACIDKLLSYKQALFELDLDRDDLVSLSEDVDEVSAQLV
ncbi:MAG: HDOD domain-containing protein [Nitrospirae bacterium]|nr:HDOD domain-containing protein [Nitrospirota bacterium]